MQSCANSIVPLKFFCTLTQLDINILRKLRLKTFQFYKANNLSLSSLSLSLCLMFSNFRPRSEP